MSMADLVASRRDEGADNTKRSGTRAPTLARVSTHRISFVSRNPNAVGTRPPALRGLNFGIDFRHAVEFSRSGRAPTRRIFRPVSGQPPNCTLVFRHLSTAEGRLGIPLSPRAQATAAGGCLRDRSVRGSRPRDRPPTVSATPYRAARRNVTSALRDDANPPYRACQARDFRRRQSRACRGAARASDRAGSLPAGGTGIGVGRPARC